MTDTKPASWNIPRNYAVFDCDLLKQVVGQSTDLQIIKSPKGVKIDDVIEAACRTLASLVDIVEGRERL